MSNKKMVFLKSKNDTRVEMSWKFSPAVSNYLQNELVKNEDYYWVKDETTGYYSCFISYNVLQEVLDVLVDNGYDISQVEHIKLPEVSEYATKKLHVSEKMVPTYPQDDDLIFLSWEYDRATNSITDLVPKELARWRKSIKGIWVWCIRKEIAKDLLPLFKEEGYDVSSLERLKDDEVVVPSEFGEAITNLKNKIEEMREDKYRRGNLAEILSADDMEGLELGEYEMIDLSKRKLPFEPYDFQIEDIKQMLKYKRYLNANEMGNGKSFESVVVGESIYDKKKLVVCPASLRLNWKKEIKNVNKKAKVEILYSHEEYHSGDDWTIIGYPSLEKHLSSLIKDGFGVLFFDEAHFIQATNNGHAASKRAKAALELASHVEYVYPITGTPKTNRNKNLYNILKLLKHPIATKEKSYEQYANRYCGGCYSRSKLDTSNSHDRELNKRITPWMVRHLRSEVLPHLTKQRIIIDAEVNLTKYEEAMKRYREINKDPSITGRERYSASLGELQKARVALAKEKIPTTLDLVNDFVKSEESVVIITCFTSVVKAVEEKFKSKCVKIVGGMSDSQKQEAVDRFQSGEVPVLVMNVIAGGVGITLTKSHIAVVNDYDFVPGNMVQAEDRICRVGQNENCLIYYVSAVGSLLDESFMSMITSKSQSINAVIDGGRGETVDFVSMLNRSLGIEDEPNELTPDEIDEILKEE